MLRVAAAQYPIERASSWEQLKNKLSRWILQAVAEGGQLLLFPEYSGLELLSFIPGIEKATYQEQLETLQNLIPEYLAFLSTEAKLHDCYLASGTIPFKQADGRFTNRAHFFSPSGKYGFQDKLMMTRFEREKWLIQAPEEKTLKVFTTSFGTIGIAICYDSEFPRIAQALVEHGADIILVPSCTDTLAGFYRVNVSCRARALENQCYVIQSPLVGKVSWLDVIDTNEGKAGVYTPIDIGCPEQGILVEGNWNKPQWVYADLNISRLSKIRQQGQVFNYQDGLKQKEDCLQVHASDL